MRLPFQSKDILYEVRSVVKFGRRTLEYKTFYSGDYGRSKRDILEIAKENIERKFLTSSGKILTLEITAVYR